METAAIKRSEFVSATLEKHGIAMVAAYFGAATPMLIVRIVQWHDNRKDVEATGVDMPRAVRL